ncbi:hypothetical protein EWM64_g2508 [Hericium alpestre]|uniref:Uncharacterized protein n=1 Tax=Hericium alpestre TaxID=135208 RepID=A0A4Z0A4Z5_9AGAM|nr:hypothetical protein EWM64_g2508 [Hericium alpestre]
MLIELVEQDDERFVKRVNEVYALFQQDLEKRVLDAKKMNTPNVPWRPLMSEVTLMVQDHLKGETKQKARLPEQLVLTEHVHRSISVPTQISDDPYLSGDEDDGAESEMSGSERGEIDVCSGVPLEWHAGSVFTTFPWQIFEDHDGTLGFCLAGFKSSDSGGGCIWIRSDRCARRKDHSTNACHPCRLLQSPRRIHDADLRAQSTATEHWPYKWLTYEQLVAKLDQKADEVKRLQIKANNQALKVHRLIVRIDDYKRLMMAVATKDVKRIRQLFNLALKEGMSPRAILSRIERAIEGVYEARGFDEFDFDLARLLRHLSGRKGLFALSRAIGLPSSTTVQNRLTSPIIVPCASRPKPSDIAQNIVSCTRSIYVPTENIARGFGLMIDGLALNQLARWWKSTNQVVGFCREHSEGLDLAMTDLKSILKVVDAVHGAEPSCHYAREATVAAAGAFGQEGYEPVPIMVSGTCKSETSEDFANTVRLLIEQWKIHGPGPLWIVSTDGDATFRGAMFRVLMDSEFRMAEPLHSLLSTLEGLNLNCSADEIVMCPDPKHIFKRAATLLRSKDGMLINDTIINRNTLEKQLLRLPGQNERTVAVLIDPKDHQNVPRAIRLLTALSALADMDSSSLDPSCQSDMCAVDIIAKIWKSLLQAFIDPMFSLSDQLRSLSTYAHMCFALFSRHKASFMTGQLYSDTQALVKAAFICIARQSLLDPTKAFYLYQLGSDRLEEIFCEVRTMSHDCNCDTLQLCDRLSASADCIAIYSRHPEWNRGHRRTSYSGNEGVDHVNPTYFKGDLVVQNTYLASAWNSGRIDASNYLCARGVHFDFTAALSESGVDFMRPFRGNTYPGVSSSEPDRSIITDSNPERTTTHLEADLDEARPPGSIELDDLLGEPDSQGIVSSSQSENRDWIECLLDTGKRKSLHKASILSSLFHSDYSRLSVDRLLRVRCYSKDWRKFDPNDNFCGKQAFLTGDLAICPIHLRDSVAVVIVKVSTIDRKGSRVIKVDIEDLGQASGSDIQITAQVLAMTEVLVADSELASSSTTFDSTGEAAPLSWTRRWAWTGNFVNVSSSSTLASSNNSSAQETTSRKDHLIHITGDLLYPITANSHPTSILPAEARGTLDAKQVDRTWAVNHDDYAALVDMLYSAADPMALLTKLTKYGDSDTLPYRDRAGSQCFLISSATQVLTERNGLDTSKIACYQCGVLIAQDRARAHVGIHILRALVGIVELGLREQLVPAFWKYAMYDHIRVNHPHHWDILKRAPQGLNHELNAKLILSSEEFSRIVKDQVFTAPVSDILVSLPFAGCETTPAPAIAPAKRKAQSRPRKNSNTSTTSKRPKSSAK